jgi:hypothetical protein
MWRKKQSERVVGSGLVAGGRAEANGSRGVAEPVTVMVVDGEEAFRAKVQSWLRTDPRFRCAGLVAGGETALMEIVSRTPAMVVVGLELPGIKGDEVIWRGRKGFWRCWESKAGPSFNLGCWAGGNFDQR